MLVMSVVASSFFQLPVVQARTTGLVVNPSMAESKSDSALAVHSASLPPFAHFLRALYSTTSSNEEAEEKDGEHIPNEIPLVPDLILPPHKRFFQVCGSHLANALELVCGEGGFFSKRSASPPDESAETGVKFNGHNRIDSNNWPFISKQKARQVVFHRQTRGVYDECCVKGCSMDELRSYCTLD